MQNNPAGFSKKMRSLAQRKKTLSVNMQGLSFRRETPPAAQFAVPVIHAEGAIFPFFLVFSAETVYIKKTQIICDHFLEFWSFT